MRPTLVDPPLLGQTVKYSPQLGVWESAVVIATKYEVDEATFAALGLTSTYIRRTQNVHLLRADQRVAFDVYPASDTGEHGPDEWCHFQANCRVPGT